MNGKVSSVNASKEASEINKCNYESVNVSWFSSPPEHIFEFFFSPDELSCVRTKNVNYLHLRCQVLEVS